MFPPLCNADGIRLDPLKLSVDVSASGYSQHGKLQLTLFEDHGIQVEKSERTTRLSILVHYRDH